MSTPVTWEEVERTLRKKDASLLVFESHQVLERVQKMGDLFASVLTMKQKLPQLEALDGGRAEAIKGGSEIAAQAEKPTTTRAKPARTSLARKGSRTSPARTRKA